VAEGEAAITYTLSASIESNPYVVRLSSSSGARRRSRR
jgi:hypothetical protein